MAWTSWKQHFPPFPEVRLFQERGHLCQGHQIDSKVHDQGIRVDCIHLCAKVEVLFPSRERVAEWVSNPQQERPGDTAVSQPPAQEKATSRGRQTEQSDGHK